MIAGSDLHTGEIEYNKEQIIKSAHEGALLQRIQMRVWDYMKLPKEERNGVEMASDILEMCKEVIKNERTGCKECGNVV